MKVTRITIEASKFVNQVADTQSAPLCQRDCKSLPIVEILPGGRVDIIDGFHRIAGMIAAGETMIACLTCDDSDILGDAADAENTTRQAAALAAIYSAAE